MLEKHGQPEFVTLLQSLECNIDLPEEWRDQYFDESGVVSTSFDERRGFARHIYRTKAVLQLETSLPAVPRKTEYVAVYSRDLSKSGVGFLHSEQLYPGEKCHLLLPTHTMPIDVMSCRKLNTHCYLVGACFNIDRENGANLQN